jgi:serine/threonine protein kinase
LNNGVTGRFFNPTTLKEGAIIAGRFRLVRVLGTGGMGSVWLADHLGLGVPCALKFIEGQGRTVPELCRRLVREAKVEAQIRGPHVVHVLDQGVWNGTPYIAMEYLEGETLEQRLQRDKKLDGATTHRIVAHVSRALMRAHALGVVHRDLKPENIFMVPDDDGVLAKVFDFGVAKCGKEWDTGHVTIPGTLIGTPAYMSPEQAQGNSEIDARSDLWSLAVIAYCCLTGHLPFVGDGLGSLLAKIMFDPIPTPSSIAPELPEELDTWWEHAAARDPDERFQSAKELTDALAVALGLSAPSHVSEAPAGLRVGGTIDGGLALGDGVVAADDLTTVSEWHSWVESRQPRAWLRLADVAVISAVLAIGLLRRSGGADEQWAGAGVITPTVMDLTGPATPPTDSRLVSKETNDAPAAPAAGAATEPPGNRRASLHGSQAGAVDTAAPAGSANGRTKSRNKVPDRTNTNNVDFGI